MNLFFIFVYVIGVTECAWRDSSDKVLLKDVSVLTLYAGKQTTARRSHPVPQLKCVGGTAGCAAFVPQVVQCYNRGSDGHDVQWECKTDMDNAYRFGRIEVICEGYDYPDDPYILKGSCGLEYTLDLTKEGHEQQHHYYGNNEHNSNKWHESSSTSVGDIVFLVVIAGTIYFIYRTCLAGSSQHPSVPLDDRPPPYAPRDNTAPPPPPGFRPEYMPDTGGCSSTYTPPMAPPSGGFWSGAATGGLLGYLFGSRSSRSYNEPHYTHPRGWGSSWWGSTGSGWGSGRSSGWTSSSSTHTTTHNAPRSTGTRTASGFGGTSRR